MELDENTKLALRAFAQWELGDPAWADTMIEIIESDDPVAEVRHRIGAEDADDVLADVAFE